MLNFSQILLQNEQEKLWIAKKVEESTQFSLNAEEKKHFARLLMKAKVRITGSMFFF
jgi:2-oxoglutarate dehydrogenase complex dehydrogenase (E1) component-like enzyme